MSRRTATPLSARQRLLAGATRVFARDGLSGATTRAIAREAGVNEVTLFRLFQSKEKLLAAVIGSSFLPATEKVAATRTPGAEGGLRADLHRFAEDYARLLRRKLPLVRAMLGEIHHHRAQEKKVLTAIFRPLRETLAERLHAAQARGEIRAEFNVTVLAEIFSGAIFTSVLRRASPALRPAYPASEYVATAVEIILAGARRPGKS